MKQIIVIGLGGFLGAIMRYGLSSFVQSALRNVNFPYGTLIVNLLGCFIIGLLSALAELRPFPPELRTFLMVGLLGAFTTFSTFSNESFNLLRGGENSLCLINIGMHLLAGLGMVWMGRLLAGQIWS
ncbi:hypothetical protein ADN00_02760 [Ornatilinea apprima]|uniref:Fluoride-specific ion channel FluC n=1 Tax=Ornatilinea apprima TaxID=1134406 RepID=A0A0P6XHS1_9CHLR|nr:fluoride efflux transporter CrcB [Ornatilinea apprima]KPL79376.1 hypothetical protein ADN00_02760 [Ornatilinea apprima]